MKWSLIALILVGVIAALCTAVLVGAIRAGNQFGLKEAASKEVKVLVAERDLPAVYVVTAEDVKEKTIPRAIAPAGHLTDRVQIVGQVLTAPMGKDQIFKNTCFAVKGPGLTVASNLKPGTRAVAVSLPRHSGLEGLIYPGSMVDVMASFQLPSGNRSAGKALSTTLLQNVEVLAIEDQTVASEHKVTEEAAGSDRRSSPQGKLKVTLLVSPQQAKALQLAMEYGQISLAMRNPLDKAEADLDATLLNEGRLAKLASIMGSSVPGDASQDTFLDQLEQKLRQRSGDGEMETAPATRPAPALLAPTQSNGAQPDWEVRIMRGNKIDVQTFQIPTNGGKS